MIDTHIHIDEEAYAADREDVIARQREAGVEAMIVPGVNAQSIDGILDICRRHKGFCFPALGFHPQDVKEDWQEQWTIIEKAIREHRDELVAIGEIGFDYYWDTTYKEAQREVLQRQLDLAKELNLLLDLGMYLGIGGVLTFKNCKLFETLEVVPLDRIVLETDGPYLAPTPHRGERNESRLMIFVVQRLAQIYEKTPEEIIAQTTKNARALFFA